MKTLFLITKNFPFGTSELYIQEEVKTLSKYFSRIIIYPNDYYDKTIEHDKILPNNVELLLLNHSLPQTKNSIKDYLFLLKHTLKEFFTTDDKKYFYRNFKYNLKTFWIQYKLALYFINSTSKVNINYSSTLFYSYWFSKSCIFLGVLKEKKIISRYVAKAHSIDLYHNDWGVIRPEIKVPPYKMFKFKTVDNLFLISQHGKNYLDKKFPFLKNNSKRFYMGVNDNCTSKETSDKNEFVIVTCSYIDFNKRLYMLAEALLQIKSPVIWHHFGDGPFRDRVEYYTKQFPNHIQSFIHGNIPNREVERFYEENQVNLFVNLSIVEGLPVSIMEAMSASIPILATNVYGTPEAVYENKNGFLLDVNFDINELVSKLNYCIENKKQLLEMGKCSKEVFLKNFLAEKNYNEFGNYLASL